MISNALQAPRATLIGGKGFIGRHLHLTLQAAGWNSYVAEKADPRLMDEDLGHVFYCAGLTADFRQRPYATVDAHVHLLSDILQRSQFSSLTYLSSTRVYAGATSTDEQAALTVNPNLAGDLYNISKLMGESLCLNSQRNVRVVRLSNVYGQGMPEQNFLSEILRDAAGNKKLLFRSAASSEKDYIAVADVVRCLPLIATAGESGIYNLASGHNTSHASLAAQLQTLGVACAFEEQAPELRFPRISTTKLHTLCGSMQGDLNTELPVLFNYYARMP
ncbi:NAD-dependent epimerase/dehydratase family protein [Undibacterium sp. Ji49W]|uniref:NAD-dependent epimerase/dehydratase family protein n=1 Tax=Undibacterium sp. Ji49W TaxID=3413040 RepID=UPI003BEF6BB2